MSKKLFLPKHIEFLEKKVAGTTFADLTALFNRRFKTNFTFKQIRRFCTHNGIRNGIPRSGKRIFTDQMTRWLLKNVSGKTYKDITPLFNNVFNTNFSPSQIMFRCIYCGIKKEQKKRIRWTSEIKDYVKSNYQKASTVRELATMVSTHFGKTFTNDQISFLLRCSGIKLGQKICIERPLYSETIRRNGRALIKISMTAPPNKRWQEKNRWVWEQANGPIPPGHYIIFLDKNPRNCELENLAIVSKAEKMRMAQYGLFFDSRDASLVGIAIARHSIAIHNSLKQTLGKEGHRKFVRNTCAKRTRERSRQGREKQ